MYLADPVHLNYLTGFWVDPFSLGAGFGAILQLNEDGTGILTHHDRLPEELEGIVSEGCGLTRVVAPWYDGVHAPQGIRGLSMLPAGFSGRIHDLATDLDAQSIFATIENWLKDKTKFEAVDILRKFDIPCAPVLSMKELLNDKSLRASGSIVDVPHKERGSYVTVGSPIKFSDLKPEITGSPLLGEHTDEILSELGYSKTDIANIHAAKAV